jgi:hypothetical protein
VFVDHYRYTMIVRPSGSELTFESCPAREKTCSTLDSAARWDTVCLKTKQYKGNMIRKCNMISNSLSTPSSTQTNTDFSNIPGTVPSVTIGTVLVN